LKPLATLARIAPLGGLVAWTVAIAWLLASGAHGSYLRPGLWPLLALALLLLLAFCFAGFVLPQVHPVGGRTLVARLAILALPLVCLIGSSGETLGAYAFEMRATGDFLSEGGARDRTERAQPPGETIEVDLLQLIYFNYRDCRVEVTGQVTRGRREPEGHFILFRFVVICCLADARPMSFLVQSEDQGKYAKDEWVKVVGVVRRTRISGRPAMVIRAESIEPVEEPEDPYLYDF
jgi:uncharacterized repeat protein (TIGR03943 family)